jgi:dihydroorotase
VRASWLRTRDAGAAVPAADGAVPDRQHAAEEIDRACDSGFVHAVKLYPAGATTNSDSGVTDVARCDAALARMAERGLPLLIHGEVTDGDVDVFDREAVFIERVLKPLLARHDDLRVVFEHITTREAASISSQAPGRTSLPRSRRIIC